MKAFVERERETALHPTPVVLGFVVGLAIAIIVSVKKLWTPRTLEQPEFSSLMQERLPLVPTGEGGSYFTCNSSSSFSIPFSVPNS